MAASPGKRYLFAAIALVVAISVFSAERFAFINRVSSLAENRFEVLRADIERLDDDVTQRIRQGEFFRFLGVRPGGNKSDKRHADVRDLNKNSDLIETAIILDNHFVTQARSGRDLSDAERSLLRVKALRSTLAESGLLRRYDISDFDGKRLGHLLLVIRPDLKNNFATMFAANYDFTTVAALSRDVFNAEEKKLAGVLLAGQTRAERTLTIRGTSYLSLRRTWLEENIILFQISPLPPFYTYLSLYFGLLLMLTALVGILHAHTNQTYTRREISERILAAHGKALQAQSGALDNLEKLSDVDREKDVSAKLAPESPLSRAAAIEAKIREGRVALSEARPPQPTPIVIDVVPELRQFRFMNPAIARTETVSKGRPLGEKEQKMRERAFSSELKNLMEAMSTPATGDQIEVPLNDDQLLTRIDAFQERYRFPAIDQYIYYLNELYFDEVTEAELAEAMRVAGDAVQSRDFAILLYDASHAVFKTGLSFGVPAGLSDVFYLLPKDSVLPNDVTDYGYIEITQSLRKNPYFKKRFPAGFTDTLKGLHVFPLAESFIKARVVFFDTARGGGIEDADVIRTVKSYLRQIAPAIQMFFIESDHTTGNPRDLAGWAVHELKECIALTEGVAPTISQYFFEAPLPIDVLLTLMRDISDRLIEGEKILLLSPSHLVVVHAKQSAEIIEELVGRRGVKFIIKDSEFGKTTRNLYTFIEF